MLMALLPVLHFRLITMSHRSNAHIAILMTFLSFYPLLLPCANEGLDVFIKAMSLFIILRFLDVATIDRSESFTWTVKDYGIY